jgi:hypothetical protein
MRPHTLRMGDLRGDTFVIDNVEEEPLYRSVQDLWRAQNAAWRARVLGQLRQAAPVDELRSSPA